MPYLKTFINDIFVSYGRGPKVAEGYDQERSRLLAHWSLRLIKDIKYQLMIELKLQKSEDLTIWTDDQIDVSSGLDGALKSNVNNSAILLVIMSNFYLSSEYCRLETSTFKTSFIDQEPKRNQVLVIHTQKTDPASWPNALKSSDGSIPLGIPFYRTGDSHDETEFSPFAWGISADADEHYWAAIRKVTFELRKKLLSFKATESGSRMRAETAGATVFLGYMNEMMQDTRDEIRRDLLDSGLIVLPDDTPTDENTLATSLARDLDKCSAYILASNEYCGLWPKGDPTGYVGAQLRIANERKMPLFFWFKNDSGAALKGSYQELLTKLEQSVQIRFSSSNDFCQHIITNVSSQQIRMALMCSNLPSCTDPYSTFETTISSAIARTARLTISVLLKADNGQIKLKELDERMEHTDSIILVCYDQQWAWALRMIIELRQLPQLNRRAKKRIFVIGPQIKIESKVNAEGLHYEVIDAATIAPEVVQEQISSFLQ
jgi:hypothetical protein